MTLSPRERQVLAALRAQPLLDAAGLARTLGTTKGSIAVTLSSLAAKGEITGRAYVLRDEPWAVVVGGAAVDVKARSHQPARAGTSNPGAVRSTLGGVGRNIAEGVARLGSRVHLVAAVGADAAGRDLIAQTADAGVYVDHLITSPHATSSYLAILDHDGELVLGVSDFAATDALTTADLAGARELIGRAGVVVVDGNLPSEVAAWVLDVAAEARGGRTGSAPAFDATRASARSGGQEAERPAAGSTGPTHAATLGPEPTHASGLGPEPTHASASDSTGPTHASGPHGPALADPAWTSVRVVLEPVSVAKAARLAPLLRAERPVFAVTPNVDELGQLVGADVADTPDAIMAAAAVLHERGVAHVWVSRGAAGSVLCGAGERPVVLAAPPVEVVDVTGAGDALTAGFVHGLLRGLEPVDAARLGHRAAAATVAAAHTVRPDLSAALTGADGTDPATHTRTDPATLTRADRPATRGPLASVRTADPDSPRRPAPTHNPRRDP